MIRNSSFKEAEGKIFWMDACCKLSMTDADWWRFLWRQGKTRNSLGRLCHVCGCFILTARWKDGLFLQLSPWWNPRLRHVACSFGTSRKKHQSFSMTQLFFWGFKEVTGKYLNQRTRRRKRLYFSRYCENERLCHSIWSFYFSRMLKIETFSPIFPLADAVMGALYWLFLGNFKK